MATAKRKPGRPVSGRMVETPVQTQLFEYDHREIKAMAASKGLSVSALVRAIVRKFLQGDRQL